MLRSLFRWLKARLLPERYDIGPPGQVYFTRWFLFGPRSGTGPQLLLHRFRSSDPGPGLHDHRWDFWSLLLWGGYWEHTPTGRPGETVRRWYSAPRLLRRPAEWRHRIELDGGRNCWSIVWVSPKRRQWGIHRQPAAA